MPAPPPAAEIDFAFAGHHPVGLKCIPALVQALEQVGQGATGIDAPANCLVAAQFQQQFKKFGWDGGLSGGVMQSSIKIEGEHTGDFRLWSK